MKFIIVFLMCISPLGADEVPILRFDNSITWKQIFDSGFRPKHLEGLEDQKCVCENQSFWVQFKGRELKFKIGNGRVAFNFLHDDFLALVWHQGTEAISLKEGKIRADEFRKVFDGYIVKEITMPRLIDPSGLVDANNAENNIEARIGEYVIWYGFDNSFDTVKPIMPHFYIAWSFPGKPDVKLKDFDDVVRPPKGYEWYSLDPKVSTPDPGAGLVHSPEPEVKDQPQKTAVIPREEIRRNVPKPNQLTVQTIHWGWWVGLLTLFVAVVGWIGKKLKNHSSK